MRRISEARRGNKARMGNKARTGNKARKNPQWSWDALDEVWAALEDRAPADLMPIPEAATVIIRKRPVSAWAASTRRNPQVREYGSGYFGVVMPTSNPEWVFKLTTDQSEAHFINAIRNLGLSCRLNGIARYSPVYNTGIREIRDGESGETIYAVWRESATVAGEDVWVHLNRTSRRTMAQQAERRIASSLDVLRGDAGQGYGYRNDKDWIAAAKASLLDWDRNPLLADTADDMLTLMEKGLVVTDINLSNWGLVPRRGSKLTLIDPGMVQFKTNNAKEAARDIPHL